jgi:hypothetical protein
VVVVIDRGEEVPKALRFRVRQGDNERARCMLEAAAVGVHQRRLGFVDAIFGVWSHSKPTISSAISPLREDLLRPHFGKQR